MLNEVPENCVSMGASVVGHSGWTINPRSVWLAVPIPIDPIAKHQGNQKLCAAHRKLAYLWAHTILIFLVLMLGLALGSCSYCAKASLMYLCLIMIMARSA